ncbi:helix-turn-helix domain-containing protein [Fodinicola acaciae]|uniref:helix-turn-helix domain-containing protein n=1 Tax=Fodinicola acaciae TaxID=2681555 RepID=UPI0013D23E13|nr:helix-turn-helix transcriptional regulator [Fodinicola acaciae]
MPTTEIGSTVPRRQLGRELRRLREAARITVDEAAEQLELSRVKMWRIEKGASAMRSLDVEHMCRLYGHGPDAEITKALMALAKETKEKGWWVSYAGVIPRGFEAFIGLETAASSMSAYEPSIVPGLLQTESYARAIVEKGGPAELSPAEVERTVELRMERQKILTRTKKHPIQLDVVLGEEILHRLVGGRAVVAEQLRHLLVVSERVDTIRIRIVDNASGAHAGLSTGGFALLDFPRSGTGKPTEPTTVYLSIGSASLYHDKPRVLGYYQKTWRALDKSALDEEATRVLVRAAIQEMEKP